MTIVSVGAERASSAQPAHLQPRQVRPVLQVDSQERRGVRLHQARQW